MDEMKASMNALKKILLEGTKEFVRNKDEAIM